MKTMETITDYSTLLQDSVRRRHLMKTVNRMLATFGHTVSIGGNHREVAEAVEREYEKRYISSSGVKESLHYDVGLLLTDGRFHSFNPAGDGVASLSVNELEGTINILYAREPAISVSISFLKESDK